MKTCILSLLAFFICGAAVSHADHKIDISTVLMRSTFKIQDRNSLGTVFIMGEPSKATQGKLYYVLITAAHVLDGIESDEALIFLRKREGGNFVKLPYRLQIKRNGRPLWVRHPDVDVAAMRVSLPKEADVLVIPTTLLETDEMLEQFEVHPGDQLFVFGFPYGAEANAAGFPILRSGRIASYPLVPTRIHKTFLLDFEIFKGNSGGPVLFYSENRMYGGKTHEGNVRFIMGIVSKEREFHEKLESLSETVIRKHKLGLAVICHASHVVELMKLLPPVEDVSPPF